MLELCCGQYEASDGMTEKTYLAIQAVLYTVPGFLHLFGLYLLYVIKHLGPAEDQRAYLINLSISESGFCFSKMVHRILYLFDYNVIALKMWIFQTGFFFTEVCFIMVLLTLDRFMAIYLNIKYRQYITRRRVKFCIAGSWLLSLTVFLVSFFAVDIKYVLNLFTFWIWPIEEYSFLIIAIPVYIYIFIKVHNNQSRIKILKKNLSDLTTITTYSNKNAQSSESPQSTKASSTTTTTTTVNDITQSSASLQSTKLPTTTATSTTPAIRRNTIMQYSDSRIKPPKRKTTKEKIKRNTFVPFLLILTFVLFWFIPDQIQLVLLLTTKKIPSEILFASNLSYIVAALFDSLIYIIGISKVREFLSRRF